MSDVAPVSLPSSSKRDAMNAYDHITTSFQMIGARANIHPLPRSTPDRRRRPFTIDLVADSVGEYFDIQLDDGVSLAPLDVQTRQRHLVLSASNAVGEDRFLCGHDERHWFTAALPY